MSNSHSHAEEEFRAALAARGLIPPSDLILGRIARCGTVAKPRSGDGAYLLHLDGVPSGGFQNHADGHGWESWCAHDARPTTPQDRAQFAARLDAARRVAEAERAATTTEAKKQAEESWTAAHPAAVHPYLARKGVMPHGLRVFDDNLVVPIRDVDGGLHSIQTIMPTGEKRFLRGGRKAGCFFPIGAPSNEVTIRHRRRLCNRGHRS